MSSKILLISCGVFITIFSQIVTSQTRAFSKNPEDLELLVLTIATEETDGYKRFMRSCRHYNLSVRVIGMNEEWRGGDVQRDPGGGHKINMMKKVIGEYKNKNNLVLMFSDSYDAVFLANAKTIIKTFLGFDKQMVFSAEGFCWPNRWLVDKYPEISHGKRYLCSGDTEINDEDDDQLYYTNLYLDEKKREKYKMALDHTTKLFQNLNGAEDLPKLSVQLRPRNVAS
ncbi:Procollagen-lysine,2-oxoglutarate 5-dioxygenase 3 [Exaiptasia diaphana]|nr:Procollagen-lysine,2-oxoglutarate 5-dioxygenase 3 [Exaiptasia diaphana]